MKRNAKIALLRILILAAALVVARGALSRRMG